MALPRLPFTHVGFYERPMIPIPRKVGGDGGGAFVEAPVADEAEVVGGFGEGDAGGCLGFDFDCDSSASSAVWGDSPVDRRRD